MATTGISNPWQGTHRVDIGASLGKALKVRRNGGEAGTSSPAQAGGPGKGRRNLPDREFYSLRYQHKPASIDPKKPGMIQFTTKEGSTTPTIVIEQASNQANESIMFAGQEIALNKLDCVLIYDEDTGTFTLEKLDGGLKLSPDRSLQSIMPREPSPSSSTPSPGDASSYAQSTTQAASTRRKLPADRDVPNEIDVEIAALMPEPKSVPRSHRSSRPQKEEEEEEEEEEELPLLQKQRLQQEQRRKQEEQQEQQEREVARREQEREAARREQERQREQQERQREQQQLRAKQREQERREQEEQEKRRREKELQDQREREQLLREQEQRRLEQQQQEQQQRRYISTSKPKAKAPPKKKATAAVPPPIGVSKPTAGLVASSAPRPLPPSREKRPAEDQPDMEEFGSIVNTRPTKTPKTKPSQTAAPPPPSSSSGGLVLPGSSLSLSALAPEPMLPSSNSIQRYGAKAKVPAAVAVPPPAAEIHEMEDSEDEDWDEVPVPTDGNVPSGGVSTAAAASPQADNLDNLEDEIFGDLFMEEDNEPSAAPVVREEGDMQLDLEDELQRQLEEGFDDYEEEDEDMEPVTSAAPSMDQSGGPISLNQMLGGGGGGDMDTDYSSSSEDDSD